MFQVLATKFEPEGKDRNPNQESSVIQTARAPARVVSWNRGHDPKFSSAGTKRDSIHHCEEHWLPRATQKKTQKRLTTNTKYSRHAAAWDLAKNYVLSTSRNSIKPHEIQPAVHKDPAWLLFSCSVVSDSLWPYELQYATLPWPSPSPEACSNSFHWVADAIQPSHPLSCLLLLPSIFPRIKGLVWFCLVFPMSWLFPSGGQSIGASASVFHWIFRVDFP